MCVLCVHVFIYVSRRVTVILHNYSYSKYTNVATPAEVTASHPDFTLFFIALHRLSCSIYPLFWKKEMKRNGKRGKGEGERERKK